MKKLVIYFSNSYAAMFDPDKVIIDFIGSIANDGAARDEALRQGIAIINWDNVNYMKMKEVEDAE